MLDKKNDSFLDLKKNVSRTSKIAREISALSGDLEKKENSENGKVIHRQIAMLKKELKKIGNENVSILEKLSLVNPLGSYGPGNEGKKIPAAEKIAAAKSEEYAEPVKKSGLMDWFLRMIRPSKLTGLERETLKRIKEKESKELSVGKKLKKPSIYIRKANQMFSETSSALIRKFEFKELQISLVKSNMNFLLKSYISVALLTALISFIVSVCLFAFFMFFSVQPVPPFVALSSEDILARILKTFWMMLVFPAGTAIFMYFYPSLERDSIAEKIDLELPFAAINMAAISGSMIDPTKIFSIIISTKEYPYLEKEFTKLVNSVNVLGYDLVTALRNTTFTTASKKLAELFNGLATTISSGGDMPKFFQERAQSMLFDYKLEREKQTKSAETFMDIYISVVIAAPMILMLLLMMMRISGLGISLSSSMITLIMVLGVTAINISFLVFLHLKQPNG